jgi:hypothetical protein
MIAPSPKVFVIVVCVFAAQLLLLLSEHIHIPHSVFSDLEHDLTLRSIGAFQQLGPAHSLLLVQHDSVGGGVALKIRQRPKWENRNERHNSDHTNGKLSEKGRRKQCGPTHPRLSQGRYQLRLAPDKLGRHLQKTNFLQTFRTRIKNIFSRFVILPDEYSSYAQVVFNLWKITFVSKIFRSRLRFRMKVCGCFLPGSSTPPRFYAPGPAR